MCTLGKYVKEKCVAYFLGRMYLHMFGLFEDCIDKYKPKDKNTSNIPFGKVAYT